ncbi:LEA type 2 family protein [Polaribacter ponticola]|uniref:LEA type 2 family protein n=1 Tax=Polaribacter ponticola TaxID=2978475 RepID=A0ABT5S8Q7_9FLAO|nr:LEA type 2 family protein [Polaribacter sp. MSW5]MDD7914468.1 LEA type 2 family protein [Polaribacter sp. MSW5]
MKKGFYFLALTLIFFTCSVKKPPVFLKVDDVKVISFASDTIRLEAKAFFKNPNDVGGSISTDEIKVIVNGTEIAQVSSDEFKVPARDEFSIPLKVVIPAKRIFESNKNGVLGGLLNSILTKKVRIQFKGNLKYAVFGLKKEFLINKTEDLKIKF